MWVGKNAVNSNLIDELQTDSSSPLTFTLLQIQLLHKYLQKLVKSDHQFIKQLVNFQDLALLQQQLRYCEVNIYARIDLFSFTLLIPYM
ncbi:hypothetical protein CV014_22005 [Nostoc sp. CMAA1605]|nr:hypothetical protein [Nostoc sp. CMAA1605]